MNNLKPFVFIDKGYNININNIQGLRNRLVLRGPTKKLKCQMQFLG